MHLHTTEGLDYYTHSKHTITAQTKTNTGSQGDVSQN
jgi:hypothetical protein